MCLGQQLLSAYTWISTFIYVFLVYKLIRWRRNVETFQTSYYLLFILQAFADFYTVFTLEVILRPRKFNYLNIFNYAENAKFFAVFSMANILIAKTAIGCGHAVIALNRVTALRLPLKQEHIWRKSIVYCSVAILWFLTTLIILSLVAIYPNEPRFFWANDHLLQLDGGILDEYGYYPSLVVNSATVIISTFAYAYCYKEVRKLENRKAIVEKRLLLCAIASSIPFLFETARSITVLMVKQNTELFIILSEMWFYEMEITVTTSLWLQILINKNVRDALLRTFSLGRKPIAQVEQKQKRTTAQSARF